MTLAAVPIITPTLMLGAACLVRLGMAVEAER
jgi:hypothetical protein